MITIDDMKELADALGIGKTTQTGFILLPNIEGFQVFEIDKKRLEGYLAIEALANKTGISDK